MMQLKKSMGLLEKVVNSFFSEINRNADKLNLSDSQKKILFSIIVKL